MQPTRPNFLLVTAISIATLVGGVRADLTFNLNDGPGLVALQASDIGLYTNVRNGFLSAAALWSDRFSDSVTINIAIDYVDLGAGILGQAGSTTDAYLYSSFRSSLIGDASTPNDLQANSNLPTGPFSMRTNNRDGSVYWDNDGTSNNNYLELTNANANAVGLMPANSAGTDASISFSSNFVFDFDRSDGILFSAYDFIGVAAHEIGHALGFISGVDSVDFVSGVGPGASLDLNGADPGLGDLQDYAVLTSLDLFRYSVDSLALGPGVLDNAVSGSPYLSTDGGATNLGGFSTGRFNGDGGQASHWLDGSNLGMMNPTLSNGQFLTFSQFDLIAFDTIGWDLKPTAVPEPASTVLIITTLIFVRCKRESRRDKLK
ncbi:MAG: NF038122 family metalloprotease [Planctomycetota bacterium]|nr:NF038122 family metalloprotease [Planctomycetota bacterium]